MTYPDKLPDRFWGRVQKSDGCWEWVGSRSRSGYGYISVHGKAVGVHRYSYELAHGPIPDGLYVCHKCDNRPCVNPDHLFLGTSSENAKDMLSKGRGNRSTGPRGKRKEKLTRGILTPEIREAICDRFRSGLLPTYQNYFLVGQEFGLSLGAVGKIVNSIGIYGSRCNRPKTS